MGADLLFRVQQVIHIADDGEIDCTCLPSDRIVHDKQCPVRTREFIVTTLNDAFTLLESYVADITAKNREIDELQRQLKQSEDKHGWGCECVRCQGDRWWDS